MASVVAVLLALLAAPTASRADDSAADLSSQGRAAIDTKYAQVGGEQGRLGGALDSEALCYGWISPGCIRDYANGTIIWSAGTGARTVTHQGVYDLWEDLFSSPGQLRPAYLFPVSDTFCGLRDGGCGQHFMGGSIYWSPRTGVRAVYGDLYKRWAAQGWERGALGYPTSAQFCMPYSSSAVEGCGQHFQGGSIYWTPGTGTQIVHTGPIRERWAAQGWERGDLGYPTSSTFCGLRNGGCGQHFEGGSLYWSPGRPALIVYRVMSSRWAAQGWERGHLGYPVSDTFCGLANGGCGQHFQGGSIYRTSHDAGRVVSGAIRDVWAWQGWENGALAYPAGEAFCGLRGGGCGQQFARGLIYWSPASGAHLIYGPMTYQAPIWHRWEREGWENGPLGYPTSSTFCGLRDGGCGQHFQGGSVYFSSWTPPTRVFGAIRDRWAAQGWENGRLGYPVGEAWAVPGGWVQNFQGGQVRWVNGRVY